MKVCPKCKASNYYKSDNCFNCGSSLVDVPETKTNIFVENQKKNSQNSDVTGSIFASILSFALIFTDKNQGIVSAQNPVEKISIG